LLGWLFGLGVIFNYFGYSLGNFFYVNHKLENCYIWYLHYFSFSQFCELCEKGKTFFSNVLDKIETNCNSLANGRSYCMAYNIRKMKDFFFFDAL
jgi:hypothetical protein